MEKKVVDRIFKSVPDMHNVQISSDGKVAIFDGVYQDCYVFDRGKKGPVNYFRNSGKSYFGSILVAKAFVKNPQPKFYTKVMYIDGDSSNCFFTNLKWCNQRMIYAKRLEGKETKIKLLSLESEVKIVELLKNGSMSKDLALEFNTSHASITRLRKRYLKEKHGNKRYHTEVKQYCLNRLKAGDTAKTISSDLGIRYETVWKWSRWDDQKLESAPVGHIRLKDLIKKIKIV